MKRKYLIVITVIIFVFGLVFFTTEALKKIYIKVFKKSEMVFHLNNKQQIEGEALKYEKGRLIMRWNFVNGLKQDTAIQYYENGAIEDKGNYKDDKPEGTEYKYYKSGKLNYTRNWRNGKLYGDFYWYLENGQFDSYNIFDIAQEQFCLYKYDKFGNVIDTKGFVISQNIYSFDYKTDSLVILNNDKYHNNQYNNIRDLYVTVATPPGLNPKTEITVNKKNMTGLQIKNNTIKVPNAFPDKGAFEVIINYKLVDKNNKVVNGLILKAMIIVI